MHRQLQQMFIANIEEQWLVRTIGWWVLLSLDVLLGKHLYWVQSYKDALLHGFRISSAIALPCNLTAELSG